MSALAGKVVELHRALEAASMPHAFGGALALAWCTRRPRATSDIDLNVFVPAASAGQVLEALPTGVARTGQSEERLRTDGQVRLWWGETPVDLFLNTAPFHETAVGRVSLEPFAREMIPFLACSDLAVFKAFFDRRRDWADIEDMLVAGSVDVDAVSGVLADYLGSADDRIARLRAIEAEVQGRG